MARVGDRMAPDHNPHAVYVVEKTDEKRGCLLGRDTHSGHDSRWVPWSVIRDYWEVRR